MKNRIFALGASAVLAVSLAACSNDKADSDSTDGSGSAVETTAVEEPIASNDATDDEELSAEERRDVTRYLTLASDPGGFDELSVDRNDMRAFVDSDKKTADDEWESFFLVVALTDDYYAEDQYVIQEVSEMTFLDDDEVQADGTMTIAGEEAKVFVGQTEEDGSYYGVRAAVVDRGNDVRIMFVLQFDGSSESMAEVKESDLENYASTVKWID